MMIVRSKFLKFIFFAVITNEFSLVADLCHALLMILNLYIRFCIIVTNYIYNLLNTLLMYIQQVVYVKETFLQILLLGEKNQ